MSGEGESMTAETLDQTLCSEIQALLCDNNAELLLKIKRLISTSLDQVSMGSTACTFREPIHTSAQPHSPENSEALSCQPPEPDGLRTNNVGDESSLTNDNRKTLRVYHTTQDVQNYVRSSSASQQLMTAMFGRTFQGILQRKEPLRTGRLADFLSSKTFEIGMLLIILSNTTYIFLSDKPSYA